MALTQLSLNREFYNRTSLLYQGLRWYSMRLRIDEDGDVADEFLEDHNCKTLPRKCKTKAAKVRGLVISSDGKLQPLMH